MNKYLELANELAKLRDQINQAKADLKPFEQRRDEIQSELIELMKNDGVKSIKTDDYNFSRTVKKDIKVVDQEMVLKELKDRKLYDEYVKPKLDTIAFKSMAKNLLKETGEIMQGTEPTETEYMSIRSTK